MRKLKALIATGLFTEQFPAKIFVEITFAQKTILKNNGDASLSLIILKSAAFASEPSKARV